MELKFYLAFQLLSLSLLTSITLSATSNGYPANISAKEILEVVHQKHYWTPPILETELQLFSQLIQAGDNIKLTELDMEHISFAQMFRRFLMRINSICHEGINVDFNLLNESLTHVHQINQMVSDSSQKLEVYLSIVPGFQNNSNYKGNLLQIQQVSQLSPGCISHVMLDLSSIDVGPLDGFSLTQKWKLCQNAGVNSGFTCGFIFDLTLLTSKASILGFLRLAQKSPVFLQSFKDEMFEKQAQVDAVHELLQMDLKFDGLLVDKKVLLNSTHFEVEWLSRPWPYMTASPIYRAVQNGSNNVDICNNHSLTSYSNLSGNLSSSIIMSISSENLLSMLTGCVNPLANTDAKYSFLEIFSRFYVFLSGKSKYRDTVSLTTFFSAVMNFSSANNGTYHLRPLRLWVGFTPEGQIEKDLNAVVKHVTEINKNLPGTVEAVVLDYNQLRVDTATYSVVKHDVLTCNKLAAITGFKCGFIFHQRNCFGPKELLSSLPTANGSILLLRGEMDGVTECMKKIRNLEVGFLAIERPGVIIQVNFQENSFIYDRELLHSTETSPFLYIPKLLRNDVPSVEATKELLPLQDWFQKPTSFSSDWVGFAINIKDLKSIVLMRRHLTQKLLTVVVSDMKRDDLYEIPRFCPTSLNSGIKYEVIFLVKYSPDFDDQVPLERLTSLISALASKCGLIVREIAIDWDQCYTFENCFSSQSHLDSANHFAGLANVTRFMDQLLPLNVKIGLVESYKTFYLVEHIHFRNQRIAEHRNVSDKGLIDLVSNIYSTEVYLVVQRLDIIVFDYKCYMESILANGAYWAAKKVVENFENLARAAFMQFNNILPRMSSVDQIRYKLSLIQCKDGNTKNGSVEYLRFLEVLNNWAAYMEYRLIIDFLYDSDSVIDCKYRSDSSYDCGCGFWTLDKTSGKYIDRKSQLKLLFGEKTPGQGSSLSNEPKTDTSVMSTLLVFSALFVTAAVAIVIRKIHHKNNILSRDVARVLFDSLAHLPDTFVETFPNSLIGKGNSKTLVKKGTISTLNGRTVVAVKEFTAQHNGGKITREDLSTLKGLIKEANVMYGLDTNKNIAKLYGVCKKNLRQGKLQLILEYCPVGSLDMFLKTIKDSELNSDRYANLKQTIVPDDVQMQAAMLSWSIQIASGLEFLASRMIVHGDIATRNILLDEDLCCKICDFGLSRKLEQFDHYIMSDEESLPWRWMAPESLQKRILNEKTDVWMYGITLWEIYTLGDVPYGGLAWSNEFLQMLHGGLRPEMPTSMPTNLRKLVQNCLHRNSEERPSFAMIKQALLEE